MCFPPPKSSKVGEVFALLFLFQYSMPLLLKKFLRTWSLSFLIAIIFLLLMSAFFPRTWPLFDEVRLYFQKHIITAVADLRYRYQVWKEVKLNEVLSSHRLAPWDILFTAEESSLGSAFIEGKRKHMLLYLWTPRQLKRLLGKNSALFQKIQSLNFSEKTPLIIESTFDGVQIHPFADLEPREAFSAFRLELPKAKLRQGIENLSSSLWKAYDFDFDLEDESKVYCSELLYPVFLDWGLSPKTEEGMWRTIISPDAMLASLLDTQLPKRMVHFLFYVASEGWEPHFMNREQLFLTL